MRILTNKVDYMYLFPSIFPALKWVGNMFIHLSMIISILQILKLLFNVDKFKGVLGQ